MRIRSLAAVGVAVASLGGATPAAAASSPLVEQMVVFHSGKAKVDSLRAKATLTLDASGQDVVINAKSVAFNEVG